MLKRTAEENARREAARKRLEEMKKQQADKKCNSCGKQFTPKAQDNNLCPKCAEDREKILEAILKQALGAALAQQGKDNGPEIP